MSKKGKKFKRQKYEQKHCGQEKDKDWCPNRLLKVSCLQILAHSYCLVLIGKANGQITARILKEGEGF